MSVTFRLEDTPYVDVEVQCEFCEGSGTDERSGYANLPCEYCNGKGYWTDTAPKEPFFDINVSNGNAADLLSILDPHAAYDDLCGKWEGERLERVRRNAFNALNTETRKVLVKQPTRDGNFFEGGRDLDYVERRLIQILNLIKLATEHKKPIVFS